MEQYQRCTRENGGDPECGRNLLRYAREAGFENVSASGSVWCFASEDDRAWWGALSAERVEASDFADQMRETLPEADLQKMASGWRSWAADSNGWLSILHGEILCFA